MFVSAAEVVKLSARIIFWVFKVFFDDCTFGGVIVVFGVEDGWGLKLLAVL